MKSKIIIKVTISLILLALTVVSCISLPVQPTLISVTGTASPLSPKTQIPFVLLPSPAITSTDESFPQSIIECNGRGSLQEREPNFGIPGALVYYDSALSKVLFAGGEDFHTWDAPITEHSPNLIGFSPNGKWMAYWTSPAKFHNISFQGEKTEFSAEPKPLLSFVPSGSGLKQIGWPAWINDEIISLGVNNPRPGQPNYYFMAYINLFSSHQWLLDLYALKGFDEFGRGIPSPDLTRVLYIQGQQDGTSTLTLVDIDSDAELWKQDNFGNFLIIEGVPNGQVAWTRDSSKVAFVDNEKDQSTITIVSRDGKIVQKFLPAERGWASSLRWSPDSRLLAIGVTDSVIVYNDSLQQIMFTCPISEHQTVKDIVWISDRPEIVYYAVNGDVANGRIILLDLDTGISTKISENVSQFGGWSSEFKK